MHTLFHHIYLWFIGLVTHTERNRKVNITKTGSNTLIHYYCEGLITQMLESLYKRCPKRT